MKRDKIDAICVLLKKVMPGRNLILFTAVLVAVFSGVFGYAEPARAILSPPGVYAGLRPVVLIEYPFGDFRSVCSGTLIAPRLVLTAAHCFAFVPNQSRFINFVNSNAVFVSSGYQILGRIPSGIWIDGVFLPTSGFSDDIAVITLQEAVPSTLAVPVSITRQILSPGTTVTSVGWGTSCPPISGGCSDTDLQQVTFPLGYGSYACPGDSGGPVLWNGMIYGVHSAGACGRPPGFPPQDLYADPARYYDQLQRLIAQYGGAPLCNASVNPPGGDQSTQFVSALDAPGATSCSYNLNGRGWAGCNLSSPPIFTGLDGGDYKLAFHVSNAQGASDCGTGFSVAVPAGGPPTSISPQGASTNPGGSITFADNAGDPSTVYFLDWGNHVVAAAPVRGTDIFASAPDAVSKLAGAFLALFRNMMPLINIPTH